MPRGHRSPTNDSNRTARERIKCSSRLSFAPNTILYSLAVVLIALGSDAPLNDLQWPEDMKDGVSVEYTKFLVAKRLGTHVSK